MDKEKDKISTDRRVSRHQDMQAGSEVHWKQEVRDTRKQKVRNAGL
jgi:hypothetical protein